MSGQIKPGAWKKVEDEGRQRALAQQEAREESQKREKKRLEDLQKQPEADARGSLETLEKQSRAAWAQQGGSEEEFKKAWPSIKETELKTRTRKQMSEKEKLAHKPRL